MWAVVFATQASTVTLWTSDTNSQTFQVPAGVTKLSTPLTETGGYMRGTMVRSGTTIIDFAPSAYYYQHNPSTYDYNAFTASSPAVPASGGSTPPPPPPPPTPTGQRIHPNGNNAKCLDVQGGTLANGTPVQM